MNNFKKPNPQKRPNSIDGFITSGTPDNSADIRKRFRSSYKPNKTTEDFIVQTPKIDTVSEHTVDFVDSNNDFEEQFSPKSTNSHEFDLSPRKKRSFLFFKRKKDKKDRKSTSVKKKIVRGFAVVFVSLILGVSSLFVYGYIKSQQIFRGNGDGAAGLQKDVDPARLNGEGDGRVNILLLGKGGPGHTAPDLTDTLLLASIDPVQNEVALLSVPRDMYVKDANGYSTKINAIYANAKQANLASQQSDKKDEKAADDAGLKAIKATVSEVLGVPVHYYTMINFDAFKEAIDTVNGITIDVKTPLYDPTMAWLNNGNPLLADKGLRTFNGKTALYYARSRYGSARGDFDRTERQKEVIVALQNKILSLGTFSNPIKVVELLNAFGNNVRTDLSGTGEIKRLYEIAQNVGSDKFISVGLANPPTLLVTTGFIDNQSVVLPVEGLYQYSKIHSFVRNKLRDPFLAQENARIVILNGTATAGLATQKESVLKSYGYNVTEIGDAPQKDFETSQLIDLTGGQKKYTKSYLEKRLGLTSTTSTIAGIPTIEQADFVIILGNDEVIKTTSN